MGSLLRSLCIPLNALFRAGKPRQWPGDESDAVFVRKEYSFDKSIAVQSLRVS